MTKRTFCLLLVLGFCAMWENAEAQITLGKPVLRGPSISTVGSTEEFNCTLEEIQTNQTILYQLFNEGNLKKILGFYSSHSKEEATIPSLINPNYDGKLICMASVQNNSEISPTFSDPKDFKVVVPVEGADIISIPSLEDLWEGDSLSLQCNITKGTYVLYKWYRNDTKNSSMYQTKDSNNQLHIQGLSRSDTGHYYCVATNYFNETHNHTSKSEGRDVHFKEYLSKPQISFELVKNPEGNFSGHVKCNVTTGSPPINYTFFRNNDAAAVVTTEHLKASFVVPIVVDQDMGTVYCQANNGKRPVNSSIQNLTVDSVGGAVTMKLQKALGQDFDVYGVWLRCHVERGTFPQYYWFLNNRSLAGGTGPFYSTVHSDNSVLGVMLHPPSESYGFYHCEATNSFDNITTQRVSSPKSLITYEALNAIPFEVVVIVFTLFTLLICAVLACCIYGVVLRKRQARKYMFRLKDFTNMHSPVDDDTDDMTEETEDNYEEPVHEDLDMEIYIEDTDVVQASMMEDSDKSEEEEESDNNII